MGQSGGEFLTRELSSECRHEYLGGRIYAMAGASAEHNIISWNIASAHSTLRGKPCVAFVNDMKVRIVGAGRDVFYSRCDGFARAAGRTAIFQD